MYSAFILNSALFERSTEVVRGCQRASMNCFGRARQRNGHGWLGVLRQSGGSRGVALGVVCVALAAGAGWIYVLWLLLLVGARGSFLIDSYLAQPNPERNCTRLHGRVDKSQARPADAVIVFVHHLCHAPATHLAETRGR